MTEMSYTEYDAAVHIKNSSDLGGAVGKPPIALKSTEFSLKQCATRIRQANYREINKRKKDSVVESLQRRLRSIIRMQNHVKQVPDGPLHWETAAAD